MQDKIDTAETFLERVTAKDMPNSPASVSSNDDAANLNVIAWTLYAVLYEQKGLDLNAEITFRKAHKLSNHTNDHPPKVQHIESHLASVQGGGGGTGVGGAVGLAGFSEGIEEEQSTRKEEGKKHSRIYMSIEITFSRVTNDHRVRRGEQTRILEEPFEQEGHGQSQVRVHNGRRQVCENTRSDEASRQHYAAQRQTAHSHRHGSCAF
jgi:hypothetical protein